MKLIILVATIWNSSISVTEKPVTQLMLSAYECNSVGAALVEKFRHHVGYRCIKWDSNG